MFTIDVRDFFGMDEIQMQDELFRRALEHARSKVSVSMVFDAHYISKIKRAHKTLGN
jgi:hypothetical protein